MKNLWTPTEASTFSGPLGECVYGSRLLGAESALVLHGGGNTSVKAQETDIHGDLVDVLYVKTQETLINRTSGVCSTSS